MYGKIFARSIIVLLLSFIPASPVAAMILGGEAVYDFGDAPGPYPTLAAENGARHQLGGVWLGAAVDPDRDGQPHPMAAGDDLTGTADEDGVMFSSPFSAGQWTSVVVSASGNGVLDAWIDFNADGDWEDAAEAILVAIPVTGGMNSLSVWTPFDASPGDTYARFRISLTGNLSYVGEALTGEVEDYLVNVAPVPLPSSLLMLISGLAGIVGINRRKNR